MSTVVLVFNLYSIMVFITFFNQLLILYFRVSFLMCVLAIVCSFDIFLSFFSKFIDIYLLEMLKSPFYFSKFTTQPYFSKMPQQHF